MLVHRFALVTAVVTFALLLLGGVVHMTESSLACPAWPMCFPDQTELLPRDLAMQPAIEYGHRLLASTVGLLSIGLAVLAFRRRKTRPQVWRMAALCVPLVIFQGVLGKITVEYALPTLVSTGHLATAMFFFAMLVVIALRAHPTGRQAPPSGTRRAYTWVSAALGAIYLQIVLGGLVRHTASGLACGTDPLLCAGVLLPGWEQGQLQMLHRGMAWLVAVLVVVAALRVRRSVPADSPQRWLRHVALGAKALVVVQILLGMASVMTALDMATVSFHMGGGVLLFAAFVSLWAGLRRPASAEAEHATRRPVTGALTGTEPGEAEAVG